MENTKITVVMPAYREKHEQIKLAIESILNQTYTDFQFIIILDDPNNKELEILIRAYAEKDARILLCVNEKNSGCPFSKDRGIRLADAEYVAIMDADDIAYPTRLEMQVKKMQEEQLDFIAGYVRVIDEDGNPLYNMNNLPLTHDKIVQKLRINNCMPHPTWFLRREAYLELNGYTDMQGCEDYDFLIRAMNQGYRFGMVDDILLDYRLSTHSISRNNLFKQYLMMQYLQDKYFHHKWDYESYEEFEKSRFTDRKAQNYAKASIYFERAIAAKGKKKYVEMLMLVIKTVFCSWDYAMKIARYVMQEM